MSTDVPTCGPAPAVENMFIREVSYQSSDTRPGDWASYQCAIGFSAANMPMKISCNGNPPRWTIEDLPKCQMESCGSIPYVANAYVIDSTINSTNLGQSVEFDVVTFQCLPGYETFDSPKIICYGSPLQWSSSPICNEKSPGPVFVTIPTTQQRTTQRPTTASNVDIICPQVPNVWQAAAAYFSSNFDEARP